ncbi:RING finger protein 17-like [Spodoptera frugiperda]|uniref:RING finger protein 17-like n=1 Tax=Spodoptera frugiperda TaxID=7108 RepID=A0A9R0DWC7_SPOFR|nr:RING finger protein 17-like [Spodoptera frugiperda]
MADQQRNDEDLLANYLGLLDLTELEEAQIVPTDNNPSFAMDWLPPKLVSKQFTAHVAHIDDEGIVSLYDIDLKNVREHIRKSITAILNAGFEGPDPKAMFTEWKAGQPCVVLHVDEGPYRGRVVEVDQGSATCLMHYIDYGYVEPCLLKNMRNIVPLRHVPPQSYTCKLNRIRPVGKKWDTDTLDFMRRSLIHKECYVRVPGDEVNGVLPIELRYESLWVNDYLVDVQRAEYEDSWKIDNSTTTGNFPTYPKFYGNEFMCFIDYLSSINTLPLKILFKDEAVAELYNDMSFDIQYEVVNMSPLDGIFENKACVALCPENYNWYRASILQYNKTKGLVRIRYVDHGDTDVIPVADIRELSTKWLKHPPTNFSAKLFGIHLNRDKYINVVAQQCIEHLQCRVLLIVNILGYEGTVPLVDVRYSSGDWVPAALVKQDIFLNRTVSVVRHTSLLKNNFALTRVVKGLF